MKLNNLLYSLIYQSYEPFTLHYTYKKHLMEVNELLKKYVIIATYA